MDNEHNGVRSVEIFRYIFYAEGNFLRSRFIEAISKLLSLVLNSIWRGQSGTRVTDFVALDDFSPKRTSDKVYTGGHKCNACIPLMDAMPAALATGYEYIAGD